MDLFQLSLVGLANLKA